jgi:putative ABC transport system permease protein
MAEAVRTARAQPVASWATALLTAAVCAVILGATAHTIQAEGRVLARIDDFGTRTVSITDTEGRAELSIQALEQVLAISSVEWAVGLGFAHDATNAVIGTGGQPVAVRTLYGGLPASNVRHAPWSEAPGTALAGLEAVRRLGLADNVGGLDFASGDEVAVVGWFDANGPLEFLDATVLVAPDQGESGPLGSIYLLARSPEDVGPLAQAVREALGSADPSSVTITTSQALSEIRAAVAGELGRSGRQLVGLVLASGLVLVGLNVYGSVATRRRDFGRRRALGASRPDIAQLVTYQTIIVALLGAVAGMVVGAFASWRVAGTIVHWRFAMGIGVLTILAAAVAAFPPAILAAYRDPVRVLRVP